MQVFKLNDWPCYGDDQNNRPCHLTVAVAVSNGHVLYVLVNSVLVGEEWFKSVFPGAQDVINNALEYAATEEQNEYLRVQRRS